MRVSDFSFDLPDELIARYPTAARSASRLLHLPAVGEVVHRQLPDVVDQLQQGDLMVFNNTKVIAARLYGHKLSGGKLEALIERVTSESTALAHVRCSKSPKPGSTIQLGSDKGQGVAAKVISRQGALFELDFAQPVLEVLQRYGHIPLPPYIDRSDESLDIERYQTVYAQEEGAVAAPTAGLHFDEVILAKLQQRGVEFGYVTLHVGAGTFQPVRVDNIHDHVMHKEWLSVDEKLAAQVAACHARGGKVVAVGTTSVRALESAAVADYQIKAMAGDTDIFIFPGYQFRCVDKLITNFHLPQSTLLMLVSAFSGQPRIMAAYKQAVDQAYRFFSYGDAMLLERQEA